MIRARRHPRGYTLIELITVSAMITILAGVGLANLKEARIQANEAVAVGAMNQLQNAYEQYRVTQGREGVYPNYLSDGTTSILIKHSGPQDIFNTLVREGFLPRNYSGFAYDRESLFAQGYALYIAPFDRPGVDTGFEDPSQNYALALQPFPGSQQRQTLAIINGGAGGDIYSGRLYKLPNQSVDFTTASLYSFADR